MNELIEYYERELQKIQTNIKTIEIKMKREKDYGKRRKLEIELCHQLKDYISYNKDYLDIKNK